MLKKEAGPFDPALDVSTVPDQAVAGPPSVRLRNSRMKRSNSS
jgi:hypothetical protein